MIIDTFTRVLLLHSTLLYTVLLLVLLFSLHPALTDDRHSFARLDGWQQNSIAVDGLEFTIKDKQKIFFCDFLRYDDTMYDVMSY